MRLGEVPAELLSRRNLLRAGGVVSLGALVAACGGESSDAPGRVGYAPQPTPLPTAEVNDAVLLRTGASYQYTAIETFQRILDEGLVDDSYTPIIERLIDDHTADAEYVNTLVTDVGGEPFECPNPWLHERLVEPIFVAINGDEAEGIAPSDDPQRDALNVVWCMENMLTATFQALAAELSTAELRRDVVSVATTDARHAAFVAYTVTGSPEGYVDPALTSTEPATEAVSYPTQFSITSTFGSLTAYALRLGTPDAAGAIPLVTFETPAENAYVYDYESC